MKFFKDKAPEKDTEKEALLARIDTLENEVVHLRANMNAMEKEMKLRMGGLKIYDASKRGE